MSPAVPRSERLAPGSRQSSTPPRAIVTRVGAHGGASLYTVRLPDGEWLGFLTKEIDSATETYPWQAFRARFVPGSHPRVGDLVGSFFQSQGGRKAAIDCLMQFRGRL